MRLRIAFQIFKFSNFPGGVCPRTPCSYLNEIVDNSKALGKNIFQRNGVIPRQIFVARTPMRKNILKLVNLLNVVAKCCKMREI